MKRLIDYAVLLAHIALLVVYTIYLPPAGLPYQLAIGYLVLTIIKLGFFPYFDFAQVYRKARETATGAGMLFISASLFACAVSNFIN